MQRKTKKSLSVILALAMVFSLFAAMPLIASAANADDPGTCNLYDNNGLVGTMSLNAALAAAALYPADDSWAIEMQDNVTVAGNLTIPNGSWPNIYLNGFVLTVTGDFISNIGVSIYGEEFDGPTTGGSFSANNVILNGNDGLRFESYVNVNITNDVTANSILANWSAITFYHNCTAYIGGNINTSGNGLYVYEEGTVDVNGDVNADGVYGVQCTYGSIVRIGGNVNALNGVGVCADYNAPEVHITGTINAVPKVQKGGTAIVTYTLVPTGVDVCEIGATRYEFLEDALDAVASGETIRLLENITYGSMLWINNGTNFTIDLNGNDLTVNHSGLEVDGSDVTFANTGGGALNCDWLIVGNGGKLLLPFSFTGSGDYYWNERFVVSCSGAGSTIIIQGDVTLTGTSSVIYAGYGGDIRITGSVTANNLEPGLYAISSYYGIATFNIGGSVTSNSNGLLIGGGGGAKTVSIGGDVNAPNGVGVYARAVTTVVNIAGTINALPKVIKDGSPSLPTVNYNNIPTGVDVCEIGATGYNFLEDALADVASGETIRLLENITYGGLLLINNRTDFTLDLNGKNLTVNQSELEVTRAGTDVTFANTGGGALNCAGLYVTNGGKLLLPFSFTGSGVIASSGVGSSLTINGNVTLTAEGGYGVYASNGGSLTVNGNVNVNMSKNYGYAVESNAYTNPSSITISGNVTSNKNGVRATYTGATVTIDGSISAPLNYIYIYDGTSVTFARTPYPSTVDIGGVDYYDYANNTSHVYVKVPAASPPSGGGPTTYTVTFNSNGGSAVPSQSVASGGKAAQPADPTKDGFVFAGWYTDAALNNAYDFNRNVTAGITLYAKWTEVQGVMPELPVNPFSDVKGTDWFIDDVIYAVSVGLIDGKTPTTFAPNDNLTYAEAVKLAACMHQLYTNGEVTLENGDPWYQSYVDYAKENGIISDDYDWGAPATRMGYMEIFANALPDDAFAALNDVPDGSIPDVPMDHPQAAAIYKLYRAGILQGVDNAHNCNPDSNIKRSEVAAILNRMMNPEARIEFSI